MSRKIGYLATGNANNVLLSAWISCLWTDFRPLCAQNPRLAQDNDRRGFNHRNFVTPNDPLENIIFDPNTHYHD